MKRKRNNWSVLPGVLVKALLALAVVLCFVTALSNLDRGRGEAGRQQLEDTLRRAAVACYATEGIYPPHLDYLTEHYGIQVDEDRYAVFYDIFAENLMPDITVVELTK